MFKIIKKADIILIAVLIALGLFITVLFTTTKSSATTVTVQVDGNEFGTYSILKDQSFTIKSDDNFNTVVIKNGSVYMKDSNCKGKDCVHQGKISDSGSTIVCLPHKIVVEVKGKSNEYDAISQ